jgi:hypothetical protein
MHETIKAILAECCIVTWELENGFRLTSRTVHWPDHTSVTRVIANHIASVRGMMMKFWINELEGRGVLVDECAKGIRRVRSN